MTTVTLSFDLSANKGLAALDKFLESRSYFCGFALTKTDVQILEALPKKVDAAKFPNVARYAAHIDAVKGTKAAECALCGAVTVGAGAPAAAGAGQKAAAKKAADSDDDDSDDDLFGDSDDEGDAKAKAKAKAAAAAKAKAAAAAKPAKKKKIERTQVIIEVKPADSETSLDDMEAFVRSITKEGLQWGEKFDRVDVAYGIQKLVANCIVQDDLVEMNDIEEPLENNEDLVQSIEIVAMQKL